ncbi:phage tail tape measure protein [Frankia sp. Ag45/Mut15]|uniref:Phage tail tape measure protein n=1 Tax=Frankia umida TaxID=573489 RepID=A0ABT0JZB1_9ACTN|nr:phage tail tape measure protein [Frankia umida]MCK9876624.1 phage tail tape measure protein [Frankia umida]
MAVVGTAEVMIVPIIKGFGSVGAQIRTELGTVGTAAAGMSGQLTTAGKAAAGTAGQVAGAGRAAAGAAGQVGAAGTAAAGAARGMGQAGAAAAGAAGGLGQAGQAATGAAGAIRAAGGAASATGGALRSAARDTSTWGLGIGAAAEKAKGFVLAATKITSVLGVAGVAAALYKGTQDANKFNAEIQKLSTQAGVSYEKLEDLKIGVLDIAGKVGADPDSLAESLFHVESNFASMGITSEKALSLVTTAAKGAQVGHAGLVDVTNALTAAVAAEIPGVENLDEAMGYLNATVGSGDMSMQDLANAMGTGAVAVVKGYGLSIKDVGAALAVFGDNNIRGAQAGTNLRMVVQSLAVPAKGGADALERLGLTQDSLAKDMQKGGLNAAVTDLHTRLEKAGISAQQQGQVLTEAFGKKAGTGLAILVSQFDRLESKYPELEHGATRFGEAWAGTQKTTKQKIDELKGSFDALLINIGNSTQGIQGKLAGAGAGAIQKLSMGAAAFANSASTGDVTTSSTKWVGQVELAGVKARAEIKRLGETLSNVKKIVSDLAPTFEHVAVVVGGGLVVGLHAFEGVVNLAANHTTALKVALIAIGGIMLANKVATLALTAAQAAQNIVFLITDLRTSSATVALGANSVAKTQNLIGTRLLTAAYNSSLVTLLRTTVAWTAQKVAMVASAVATRAMVAGQWLLNAAMSANPVMLVVIAIAALVAGAILAYKHVGWFRDAVDAVGRALKSAGEWVVKTAKAFGRDLVVAFHAVEDAAKSVGRFFSRIYDDAKHWLGVALDFVKKWWPLILIVMSGGALAIPVLIAKYWRQIYDFTVRIFTDVKNFVVRIFNDVKNGIMAAVNAVVDFFERHWRLILVIATGVTGLLVVLIVNNWSRITGFFKAGWETVSGFISRMWHDVAGFFSSMWSDVSNFARRIWNDVSGFFQKLWSDVSGFASRIWRDVAGFFSDLWRDVSSWATRTWHDVAGFFSDLWRDVSGFAKRIWSDVAGFFADLWRDVSGWATRIWHDVAGFFTNLWHDVSGFVSNLWHDVAGFFSNLWRDVTGWAGRIWHETSAPFISLWHDMTTTASNLWKDVTGWFERIKNDITNSVKTATGWIKGAWDGLKDIFKAPINFLINPIYNDGIRKVWNAFAPIVHESKLEPVNGFAAGGPITGGVPGRDSVLAWLMPGEHVWTAAEVAAAGGQKAMFALRRLFGGGTQARGPGMALGGVVGAVVNAVTDPLGTLEALGSGTLDVLGTAVHWVRGALADAAQAAFTPIRAAVNSTLGQGEDWKGAAGRMAVRPMDAIVELLRGQDKTDQAAAAQAAASAGGAARWAPVMTAALAQAGESASWLSLGLQRMNQESGGDPNAVNRWDSNWTAGHPSVGLMQLINSTFAAYAGPYRNTGPFSYGVSTDPMANVYASIKYTDARYGSLSAWGRPGGYDTGGGKAWPTGTLGYNLSGETEYVWKGSQLAGMSTATTRGGTTNTFHVAVDARGSTDPAATERAVRRGVADALATLDQMLQQGVGGGS